MPVERKQSFSEIMASLDVQVDLPLRKVQGGPCPQPAPDTLDLSIQGEKALPQRKPAQKDDKRANPDNLRLDNQGNKVRISARGNILAEAGIEDVAWETRLK